MRLSNLATAFVALTGFLIVSGVAPALARGGGGSNIMNSPGYQRALEESRRPRAEPDLKPPTVYPRKKWRHRGRR